MAIRGADRGGNFPGAGRTRGGNQTTRRPAGRHRRAAELRVRNEISHRRENQGRTQRPADAAPARARRVPHSMIYTELKISETRVKWTYQVAQASARPEPAGS